jgi:hypothetical protein
MLKIWDAKNATIGNMDLCLAHQSKGHLMSLTLRYILNRSTSCLTNFLDNSLVSQVISKMSRLKSSSLVLFVIDSKVAKRCENLWVFKSIGKRVFFVIVLNDIIF